MNADAMKRPASVDKNASTFKLNVSGGRLDGSFVQLPCKARISVGSDIDNDIVLRERSIAPRHFMLGVMRNEGGVEALDVEVIEKSVTLGDETLQAGEQGRFDDVPMQVGELTLQISQSALDVVENEREVSDAEALAETDADQREEDDPSTENRLLYDPDEENSSLADDNGAGWIEDSLDDSLEEPLDDSADAYRVSRQEPTSSSYSSAISSAPQSSPIAWRYVASLALLSVLCLLAVAGWQWSDANEQPERSVSIKSLLAASSFDDVQLQDKEGALTLVGHVATRKQAMELQDLVANRDQSIVNRTIVIAEMLDKVDDIFRVNGVDATAASSGSGDVTVTTATADVALLARLQDVVTNDVPQVGKLVIDNALPAPSPPTGKREKAAEIKGKRVAMVVSDEPAYLVTEDQSHYFVGAMLPSGHRIEAIENGRVSLARDGIVTELEF